MVVGEDEYLRLAGESSERGRVQDAVAVAFEAGALRVGGLGQGTVAGAAFATQVSVLAGIAVVITFIGYDFGALLGGAIVTERIFNIQGVGGYIWTGIHTRDGNAVVGAVTALVIVFLIVISIYITLRFEFRMAMATLAALVHDLLIVVGVYAIFQFAVTPATVIALLTILGFSIYDGIVVFDRVNENTKMLSAKSKITYSEMANLSLNQVLMRSLNTSITSLLPILSVLIVGSFVLNASTLEEFGLALFLGLLSGAYSSIFIATPLLTVFKERESRYAPYTDHHATGSELERLVLGGSPAGRREHRRGSAVVAAPAGRALVADQPAALETPEALLTHPPRPRKKKRR